MPQLVKMIKSSILPPPVGRACTAALRDACAGLEEEKRAPLPLLFGPRTYNNNKKTHKVHCSLQLDALKRQERLAAVRFCCPKPEPGTRGDGQLRGPIRGRLGGTVKADSQSERGGGSRGKGRTPDGFIIEVFSRLSLCVYFYDPRIEFAFYRACVLTQHFFSLFKSSLKKKSATYIIPLLVIDIRTVK